MKWIGRITLILLIILGLAFAQMVIKAHGGADREVLPSDVVNLAKKRSVFIETTHLEQPDSVSGALTASEDYSGTGVVIAKDLVLTNSHILQPDSRILVDGKVAQVIKRSRQDDLALLAVDTERLPRIEIGVGAEETQRVFYVGNPGTTRDGVFPGQIIGVDEEYLYTDSFDNVQMAMGASGSGLYAADGRLIGLKKGMVPGDSVHPALSVAIRAETILKFLQD